MEEDYGYLVYPQSFAGAGRPRHRI